MQLMTWPLARLGSRFGLLFEPQRRRLMHSALGRFLDQPLDLAVGLIEPDGTERVLPFTQHGQVLFGCEQFERINSITFRGHCEACGVRFELNFHSPFYPQEEELCLLPVIYVELRVTGEPQIRSRRGTIPEKVRVFVRVKREQTRIEVGGGCIHMSYDVPLTPNYEAACGTGDAAVNETAAAPAGSAAAPARVARVVERIRSLNDAATPVRDEHDRAGLTLELPVTDEGSGIKWRLVWAAHTADPVLDLHGQPAPLRYLRHWRDLDAVMAAAISRRDENLAMSRRFEKLLDQAPLDRAQWHLLVLAFQTFLSNTFWCERPDGRDLFTAWDGSRLLHNPITAGYDQSLLYLALWPRLMRLSLEQWAEHCTEHSVSGGVILQHDQGQGLRLARSAPMPQMAVELNSDYLLLLQFYAHLTGDTELLTRHSSLIDRLAAYLLWSDRESTGFSTDGTATEAENGTTPLVRRRTWLAIKRVSALDAAGDLLQRSGVTASAERYRAAAGEAVGKIDEEGWLEDHYAFAAARRQPGFREAATETILLGAPRGWDDYTIHTTNALLLPTIIAQPSGFDLDRLRTDLVAAHRETLRNYACTNVSSDMANLSVSRNVWRDHTARYLHVDLPPLDSRYWDLQLYSNTYEQSMGFCDSYIADELAFSPRGAAAFGYFFAGPRLQVDRLDGDYVAVDPDRNQTQRWPLLPLADWAAGKVPICYVDAEGHVRIEGRIETVKVIGEPVMKDDVIG